MKNSLNCGASLLALSIATAFGSTAHAQNVSVDTSSGRATPTSGPKQTSLQLEEVVVTASSGTKKKLRSSLSVTDVSSAQIQALAPQSQAEVLRLIPGMIVGDTAGPGGNANISVRGLPITTGGSPFVQLQEDGLPTVLSGDMNFGNNDYWVRFSNSDKVEAVRGGSASTLASQAPGAVINYISQTGRTPGGVVSVDQGLNYNTTKLNFDYGAPVNDTLRYHIEGFGITGSGGIRDEDYRVQRGYQVKGNITQDFDGGKGYARLYFKALDDREPTNTAFPNILDTSGDSITGIHAFPGFDSRNGTNMGTNNRTFQYVDDQGHLQTADASGIHPKSYATGLQLHYNVNDDFQLDDNVRREWQNGTFSTNFLGLTPTADIIGSQVNGQTVGSILYANGGKAGQAYTNPYVNTNVNIYTHMKDMGNIANDASFNYRLRTGSGDFDLKAGVFYFDQTIAEDWHPNSNYSEVSGSNPAELNLFTGPDGTGQQLSVLGQTGYNNHWGDGANRIYNMDVADTAPYANLSYDLGPLDLEASTRFDRVHVSGYAESADAATDNLVINNNGVLIPYSVTDPATRENLNYNINYTSWSFGALYQINRDFSVFARGSKGGKVNTDRNILSGYTNPDGSLNASGRSNALDTVFQEEWGLKSRFLVGDVTLGANVTGFHDSFNVSNFDLTNTSGGEFPSGTYFLSSYAAYGMEFEGTLVWNNFSFNANVTYTDANQLKNEQGGSPSMLVDLGAGFPPPNTPSVVWLFAPTYTSGPAQMGFIVQGQNRANVTSGGTPFYGPPQNFVDLFFRYNILPNAAATLHVNNLFNSFGINGHSDQSSTAQLQALGAAGGLSSVGTAPGENGRAISLSLSYKF